MTDREQLEQSIVALERQRLILGDVVVDSSTAILREKLASLDQSVALQRQQAGERKLVTVIFADISGFTALSEQLDPEQVRALVNACFAWLVPVIEKYGGVVEKFIGDEIMAMFGAPAAHENDPERALRASLEMMSALDGFNREHCTSLGMHFGVNTGMVVAGGLGLDGHQQYGVMGDTVNVAARLEHLSEAAQIIVGPATYRLTASMFDYESLPPVSLKGKSELVPVYRLLGLKPVPEPARGIAGLRSPLVGRDAELSVLVETVSNLPLRLGSLISIVADPGLGKSRLVSEARLVTGASALWVEGRALSYAEGISYWMVRSMLDHLIGVEQDASPAAVSAALQTFVSHYFQDKTQDVFPYLARLRDVPMDSASESVLRDLLPQALQGRMHAAFAYLVRAVALERPLVLVWEDFHWADPSTLGLLETLLDLSADLPLLQLLVLRPNEGQTGDWQRRMATRLADRYRLLELSPLTPGDSAMLVENLLKIENLPEATRQLLLNKAEGNPFFLEELLRSLLDSGMLLLQGDHAVAARSISQLDVPDTLQGVIAARIDCLPSVDKYTLQTAAVIGRVFQEVVLRYLLQRQAAGVPVASALNELQQRELIRLRSHAEYIFKHAITHDVAYNSLLVARRQELHLAAGQTMEMLFPGQADELAPTLAFHYEAAGSHQKAAHYFMRAAERAGQTYANLEAIAFYQAAIRQWEQLADRENLIKAYEGLGMVMGLLGRTDEAVQFFEIAIEYLDEGDALSRARLYRREGIAYNVARRLEEMLVALDRAVAASPPRSPESMPEWLDLQLDRMLGNYFANRLPEMMAIVAELRPFIEEHGTLAQKARWFESLQLIDIRRCRFHQLPDETLENARRQVETARLSGNRRIKGRALAMLGFVHMWRGELDDAENAFLGSIKDAEAVGDVDTQFIDHYMGLIGRMRGDVELTRRWASSTLALARKVNSLYYQIGALGSLAWAALHEGDEQAARAYVQEGLALKKQAPSNTPWFMLLGPALVLDLRAGDYASAIAHVRTMLQPNQRWMPPELESLLGQAVAALDAGDVETVEALLGQGLQSLKQHQLGYV